MSFSASQYFLDLNAAARAVGAMRIHEFRFKPPAISTGKGVPLGAVIKWIEREKPEEFRQGDICRRTGASVYTVSKACDSLLGQRKISVKCGRGKALIYGWRNA